MLYGMAGDHHVKAFIRKRKSWEISFSELNGLITQRINDVTPLHLQLRESDPKLFEQKSLPAPNIDKSLVFRKI
jgi:hypothetical protein